MARVRKKKINTGVQPSSAKKKQKTVDLGWNRKADEHIDSDEDDDVQNRADESLHDDDEVEEEEALDAKRVRLARKYLQKLEDSDDSSSSHESSDGEGGQSDGENDRIGLRLQRERLKREGAWERAVADKVLSSLERIHQSVTSTRKASFVVDAHEEEKEWIKAGRLTLLRGHDLPPTCVALQSSGETAISGSKDHSVLLWDVENEKRASNLCSPWKIGNHDQTTSRSGGQVLSLACSDDGRYAAVGRRDATVSIFDIRAGRNSLVKTFLGHKGPVTCLCFRSQSLQLFSGSDDRCIRHYNLNEMMYLETLYGHQFGVMDIDCHRKERPVSVGRDRTARAWKLAEDTHLIFRGGARVSSADCVNVIRDDWYLTGHDDGHLALWMTEKKKAVASIDFAHGSDGVVGRGICSIGTLKGSDLAITGSYDGYLRLWKAMTGSSLDTRRLDRIAEIPLIGYVNGIAVGPKARFCVVALGQEPKLGRWNRIVRAKNRFGIVSLRNDADGDDESEDIEDMPAAHGGSDEDVSADADSDSS